MKRMKQLARRMLRCRAPRQKGKVGSSLAMVMIVTAALVIWVMCIMPLMVSTGTTATKVKTGYDHYLGSRSAIEYAKSELEHIVESDPPYTFAVVKTNTGTFDVIPQPNPGGAGTNPSYNAIIDHVSTDHTLDTPNAATGNHVAAICAVTPPGASGNEYQIKITAFVDGEKLLSYSATFTLRGSLLIYPEAYKQTQALPISDFVLVDGKLGANTVWNSSIEMVYDNEDRIWKPSESFTERMLAWKLNPGANYASSGKYPSVFKKTALPALNNGGQISDDPLTDGFTSEEWSMPFASHSASTVTGAVWIDDTSDKVYMRVGNNTVEVTNDYCRYNGSETCPTSPGIYQVTLNYPGTGAYNAAENGINILPRYGLVVGTMTIPAVSDANTTIKSANCSSGKVTVEINPVARAGALYGYCTATDPKVTNWQTETVFSDLPFTETYYFYCYIPSHFEDTIYYPASEVAYAGMVHPYNAVTSLSAFQTGDTSRTEYLIMNDKGVAVEIAEDTTPDVMSISYSGSPQNGVLFGKNLSSEAIRWTPLTSSGKWRYSQGVLDTYGVYDPQVYLAMTSSSINISPEANDESLFSCSINNRNNNRATVTRSIRSLIFTRTYYLSVTDSNCQPTTSDRYVYFVEAPAAVPSIEAPFVEYNVEFSVAPGTASDAVIELVNSNIIIRDKITAVYANSNQDTSSLVPGTYQFSGLTDQGRYVTLGTLTVGKYSLSETSVSVEASEFDGNTLTITGQTENGANSGAIYLGYKKVGPTTDTNLDKDFHWVLPSTVENGTYSFTFCLDYGEYLFAIAESGTWNHGATHTECSHTVVATPVDISPSDKGDFIYTISANGATWYELPAGIRPSMIRLVYGKPADPSGYTWQETPDEYTTVYGAIIAGSEYSSLDNVYLLENPVAITNANGCTSSVLKGSSLYFMGAGNSIDTKGNDIFLTADLVVLNNPITGGGRVIVEPYSTGEEAQGDTLLYAVHDINRGNYTIFEAKTFYRIPKNTDILNLSPSKALSFKFGTLNSPEVKYAFRNADYPEVNMDIAYTDQAQLSHIISSETIDWTNNGALRASSSMRGSSSNSNVGYAVCTYVSSVAGNVNYKANRVLIAAENDTMVVPYDVQFTTRYLSIDAANLQQGAPGVKFRIWNLGQDEDILRELASWLGITNYRSKSLQMDYEQYTNFLDPSGNWLDGIDPQICRYDHGANLFNDPKGQIQPLMATYSISEIEELFSNGLLSGVASTVKTVDRYVTVAGDGQESMDMGALADVELDVYANYVYFAPSVKGINLSSMGNGKIIISSQENGYTSEEYLGLFKIHSAESYSGTLLYFSNNVKLTYTRWWLIFPTTETKIVRKGFYYIPASDPDGVSLGELADDPSSYWVDPRSLKDYSIYINPDGSLSNAYVDTGLFDNSSIGVGGFSGGKVE